MAVIKFGSLVTSGRGSLGGSTIQPCHSGHILRNKPNPKKSRTQAQSIIRGYNSVMQAGWIALSDQDRKVWNDYARVKPVFNRSGEKYPLSGHSLWLKYQFSFLSQGFVMQPDVYKASLSPLGPELFPDPDIENPGLWTLLGTSYILNGVLYGSPLSYRIAYITVPLLSTGLTYRFRLEFTPPYLGSIIFLRNTAYQNFIALWDHGDWYVTSSEIICNSILLNDCFLLRFLSAPTDGGYNVNHVSIREILP